MRRFAVSILAMACWLLPVAVARAAFPGQNGVLAVVPVDGNGLILTSTNGGHTRRICASTVLCGRPQRPMFSPDGRSLVFSGPKMRLIGTDGTCENCRLGPGASPSFRGDGTTVSFISPAASRAGAPVALSHPGVLKQDAIDGLPEKGPHVEVKDLSEAVWSASGRLAVVSHGRVLAGPPTGQLRAIGPGADPSWSPTGTRLAVASRGWVTLISVPGDRAQRLVRGTAPAFSPDGRWVAYFDAQHQLRIIRASGGRPRRVGDVHGRAVDWQPLPAHPAACVAPPGSQVLARSDQAVVTEDLTQNVAAETGAAAVSGCLFADGREHVLRRADEDDYGSGVDFPVAGLGGPYAGVVINTFDAHYGGGTETLSVYDLRTGKPSGFGGEKTCSPDAGPEGDFCPAVITQVLVGAGGVSAVYLGATSLPVAQHVVCSPDPSTSLCVTSDDYGEFTASTSPSTGPWDVTAGVRPDNGFNGGASCPSASLCVVATDSTISTATSPTTGPWTTITFPGDLTFENIACPSTTLCLATTSTGQIAVSTDPTGGPAAWSLQDIDAQNGLQGLSCPSTTECVAADSAHNVLTTTDPAGGPSAWTIQSVAGSVGGLSDISCPTTSFCAATITATPGTSSVATSNRPTGNAWTTSPGSPPNVSALTCPTTSLCVYLSQYDIGTSSNPVSGPWTSFSTKDTGFAAATVSCTGPSLCIAAGQSNGTALVSTDPSGGADAWAPVQSDPVNCAVAGLEPQGPCGTEQIISSDRTGIHTVAQHTEYSPQSGEQITGLSLTGDTLQWLDQENPMTSQLTP